MSYTTEQPGDQEKISQANTARARRVAITFGVITCICLISLIYAYVQHGVAQEAIKMNRQNEIRLTEFREELVKCKNENEQIKNSLDSTSRLLKLKLKQDLKK